MAVQYSTAQKLALAGIALGALLSAVGGCAPYWLVFDPEGFGLLDDLVASVASANMGPFVYCVEVLGNSKCYVIGLDETTGWLTTVRITTAVCVLVGLFCGLCALCLACCTCCKRFIALGILAFLAAGCGAFSAVVFSKNTELFTQSILGYQLTSYGWAFYVFCAGLGVLGLLSFVACFAAPDHNNAVHGMVMNQPPTQVSVVAPSAPPPPHVIPTHPFTVMSTTGM